MATNPATPEFDAATQKWLTYNNNRNGKLEKLQEDNNKLKAEMAKLKATHSRIRRIPKKGCEATGGGITATSDIYLLNEVSSWDSMSPGGSAECRLERVWGALQQGQGTVLSSQVRRS